MYSVLNSLDENINFRLKIVILLSFFTIIFEYLSIISIFPVIKTFINPGYLNENINFIDLSNLSSKQINIIIFSILLLIFIFKNIFIYIINILQSKIVNFAIYNMTSFFFNSYLKLDYRDFTSKNSAELMRNVVLTIPM